MLGFLCLKHHCLTISYQVSDPVQQIGYTIKYPSPLYYRYLILSVWKPVLCVGWSDVKCFQAENKTSNCWSPSAVHYHTKKSYGWPKSSHNCLAQFLFLCNNVDKSSSGRCWQGPGLEHRSSLNEHGGESRGI